MPTTDVKTTQQKIVLIRDRVDLYKDFAINLIHYIDKYYIDKTSLSTDVDIDHHFSFCYKKVVDEFKRECIDFSGNKELYEYFHSYYYENLYKTDRFDHKDELPLNDYIGLWKNVFSLEGVKNKNTIGLLVEIYNIFDKSITKK